MSDPYVSSERRKSAVRGTGIQYIPGHVEGFVDLVTANYIPPSGRILDLAGGGLRFAIPLALSGRDVLVVDRDESALDITSISERVAVNDRVRTDASLCHRHITTIPQEVRSFLRTTDLTFSLITAFRLTPYFTPSELSDLFGLVSASLDPRGTFALSGLSPTDVYSGGANALHQLTKPVGTDPLYREFCQGQAATNIRREQNLRSRLLFSTRESMDALARRHGLAMIEEGICSTRIFVGYVLRKSSQSN